MRVGLWTMSAGHQAVLGFAVSTYHRSLRLTRHFSEFLYASPKWHIPESK